MRIIPTSGMSLPRSHGFSLIEAVVVVSLFGIVAAFAVPRFTRLANNVRASEVVALSASLRLAAQAAHAQFLASGGRLSSTMIKGRTVILKNGYPDVGSGGIRNAVFDSDGFTSNEGASFVVFMKTDAPFAEQCSVTYNASSMASGAATVANLVTSGC